MTAKRVHSHIMISSNLCSEKKKFYTSIINDRDMKNFNFSKVKTKQIL